MQDGALQIRAGQSENVEFEGTFLAFGHVLRESTVVDERSRQAGLRIPTAASGAEVRKRRFGFESPNRSARQKRGLLGTFDDDDDNSVAGGDSAERGAPAKLIHSVRLSREAAVDSKDAADSIVPTE